MEAINILSARLVRAAFAAFLLPLTISAGQFGPAYSRGKSYLAALWFIDPKPAEVKRASKRTEMGIVLC